MGLSHLSGMKQGLSQPKIKWNVSLLWFQLMENALVFISRLVEG